MTIQGNEMTVQRGETFTIDRIIVNRDGSPFVVSSQYKNPYLLLTVASTKYNQDNRYVANFWLDLTKINDGQGGSYDLPRFNSTRIKTISSKLAESEWYEDGPMEYVYYVKDEEKYCYWPEYNTWLDYEFRFIHHFTHNITRDWVGQSYVYSIRLVSGNNMTDYLRSLYITVLEDEPSVKLSNEELYNKIKEKEPSAVEGLIWSRPIVNFDVVQDVLLPTKLTVLSDLNGGLK